MEGLKEVFDKTKLSYYYETGGSMNDLVKIFCNCFLDEKRSYSSLIKYLNSK